MNIAFEYAKLCEERRFVHFTLSWFFEWQLTQGCYFARLKACDELLAENPYLKDSLDYRMPYFNVLELYSIKLTNAETWRIAY